jgi:nicotinamide-nucleotide amidase
VVKNANERYNPAMNAIILSVGDELVLGQTVDTNSAWISQQLAAIGCGIVGHQTVGDDQLSIEKMIAQSVEGADVIILSGGLGPTDDDLTRQAIAAVLNAELVEDPRWTAEVQAFFARLGRQMPERNRIQSMIPRGAEMLWNTNGTAAGIKAEIPRQSGAGAVTLFAVPGVPKEMKAMFARDVFPWVRQRSGGAAILSRTLHTFGLGESAVADRLGDLMARDRNPSVGTTVSGGIVSLRVNSRFSSEAEARERLDATAAECRAAMGDIIFGEDEQNLGSVVARILLDHPQRPTVATAESCTGGITAKMLTDTPGSSAFFRYGWVTYANEAKTRLLGVPEETLKAYGAVSEQTVAAMVTGARERASSTYALSISGIAGPDGGTPEKPVGTVWFALAHPAGVTARRFVLTGDREMIRDRAAKMALTMLRFELLGKALPF